MPEISEDRITFDMDVVSIVSALSEGNPGATGVLVQWFASGPMALMEMLTLDTKRLYGSRIWEIYSDVCGHDLERFKYHVQVELPNQETGSLSVSGPLAPRFEVKEFWEKRQSGKPGANWALDVPPTTSQYTYPLY